MRKIKILEKDVRKAVKDWLAYDGWFIFYHFQGLGCYRGISDLTAMKGGRCIWVEIKTATGKQSEHQEKFESMVKAAGGEYVVARSSEDIETYIALQNCQEVF